MTARLEGKVALITGAGMGMGREACLMFSAQRARIVALDIDPGALDETARLVRRAGGEIATFPTNVANEHQVRNAVDGGVDAFGTLHVLYNNAGVLWRDRDVGVLEVDESVWDQVMAINIKGMVWVCKYGIPKLIEAGGGAIINVGSTSALLGDVLAQDAYTASKGAIASLTRSLAVQFGPNAIRANCIHPGFVDTPMQKERTADPKWVSEAISTIPLGRLGQPRDVVSAALFLASDDAAYVTGAELVVDGGNLVT